MGDRRAPDADRDVFPADRWTELRLESSLGHREPFVNPLGRVCPSVNPVNRQSPSALPFHSLLCASRMHNQTAVSLMQIAVSIDRAKLRTLANLLLVEYTASLQFRKLPAVIFPECDSCLITIYKPLQTKSIFILFIVCNNPSCDIYHTYITFDSSLDHFFSFSSDLFSISFTFYLRIPVIVGFLSVLPRCQSISSSNVSLRITVGRDELSNS